MRYLSGEDLVDLILPQVLIASIEEALRDFAAKRIIAPLRQHIDFADNTLLTMPVVGRSALGAKMVSVVPSNTARGLPVINGLMILSDVITGLPLAILDAAGLTAQRTGAVGAVGLKYTVPPDVHCIGIIGTGVQGTWQAIYACAVRDIHTVFYISRSNEQAHQFTDAVSRHVPSVRLTRCTDTHELLTKVPVVITATTSSDPVVPARLELLENKHFIGIGSFKPSMKELPHSVYQLARQVVVDSDAAMFEVGDLIEPLSSGSLRKENIIHVAEIVVGRQSIDTKRTTVFKSVGSALYDLYAASAFYAEAQRLGRGIPLQI
jgi:ornithine cyclodeaminase/alanine dehydrogenase-like protein (mu-crystallin family)